MTSHTARHGAQSLGEDPMTAYREGGSRGVRPSSLKKTPLGTTHRHRYEMIDSCYFSRFLRNSSSPTACPWTVLKWSVSSIEFILGSSCSTLCNAAKYKSQSRISFRLEGSCCEVASNRMTLRVDIGGGGGIQRLIYVV